VRHFDRYRNGMRRPGDRQQPITQLRQTRTVMRELPFRDDASLNIDKTCLVPFGAPVDAGKPCKVRFCHRLPPHAHTGPSRLALDGTNESCHRQRIPTTYSFLAKSFCSRKTIKTWHAKYCC
jgi:hypothetical protein